MGMFDGPHEDGEDEVPVNEYVPVCPICRGMCRRDLNDNPLDWLCDTHGYVMPRWVKRGENDDSE
jgi:hypothetical protein